MTNQTTLKESQLKVFTDTLQRINETKEKGYISLTILTPEYAFRAFRQIWDNSTFHIRESLYVIFLDKDLNLLKWELIRRGGSMTADDIAVIAAMGSAIGAAAFITATNTTHDEEVEHTKALMKLSNEIFPIKYIDYIMMAQEGFWSIITNEATADELYSRKRIRTKMMA